MHGQAVATPRRHADTGERLLPGIVLLCVFVLALLARAAVAQAEGLTVEIWDQRTPVRSFPLTGDRFDGALVLRLGGTATRITVESDSILVSADGSSTPLAVTLRGDGTVSPDQPVTVVLSADGLSGGQIWRGDIWFDAVDAQGAALPRTSVPIEIKRETVPATALTLALDTVVPGQYCLPDWISSCPPITLQIRGSLTNTHTAALPVPEIVLRSLLQTTSKVAYTAKMLKPVFDEICAKTGAAMQPKQSCTFVLTMTDLPPAGSYDASFAAQTDDAPLQTVAMVSLKLRSSWWLMVLLVCGGVLVSVWLVWWGKSGRARVALMPDLARQRDRAASLGQSEQDAKARAVAEKVAGLGVTLLGTLLNPAATAADPAVLVTAYTQKIDVLERWLATMQVVRRLDVATQQALEPQAKAVSDLLVAASTAPDDALKAAFEALLKAVDAARASAAMRAKEAEQLAAFRAQAAERLGALALAAAAVALDDTARKSHLEGLRQALQTALDGNDAEAIQTASDHVKSALFATNEAIMAESISEPQTDDILQTVLSLALPGATASAAAFRLAAILLPAAAALFSMVLTCLAATQIIWFSTPDWGTPEHRLAAFAFGLAVGYGTQSVMTALVPKPGG